VACRDVLRLGVAAAFVCVGIVACRGGAEVSTQVPDNIPVASSAFADGAPIPALYTCRGDDVSPQLSWTGVPEGTAEIALVVDDPDAPRGTFTHWVLFGLAPTTTDLAEGAATSLPAGGKQAKNSAGRASYMGPCPPSGTHHYRFTVYALGGPLGLDDGAGLAEALTAIEKRAVAQGRLVGLFSAG